VIAARPKEWQLYAQRAAVQSKLGKAAECRTDQGRAIELGADGDYLDWLAEDEAHQRHWDRAAALWEQARRQGYLAVYHSFPQALVCLELGDQAGYRAICTEVVKQRLAKGPHRGLELDCAELCTLGPGGLVDYGPMLRVVGGWAAKLAASHVGPWHQILQCWGGLEYRAGHYSEAITHLQEDVATATGSDSAYDCLFLAMAHYQLGNAMAAKEWLGKALVEPLREGKDHFWGRLELELLRREAQALVR
jgi:hypothetical protein